MMSAIDNWSEGSAFAAGVVYVFECGMIGIDLDDDAGVEDLGALEAGD